MSLEIDVFTAVRQNDMPELSRLLGENPELVNATDPLRRQTPLFIAVAYGYEDAADLMLSEPIRSVIDISIVDIYGRTPMTAAIDCEIPSLQRKLEPIFDPPLSFDGDEGLSSSGSETAISKNTWAVMGLAVLALSVLLYLAQDKEAPPDPPPEPSERIPRQIPDDATEPDIDTGEPAFIADGSRIAAAQDTLDPLIRQLSILELVLQEVSYSESVSLDGFQETSRSCIVTAEHNGTQYQSRLVPDAEFMGWASVDGSVSDKNSLVSVDLERRFMALLRSICFSN